MIALSALWLPILVSAIVVFVASSIIHMLPLWHRSDYPAPPRQDEILDALRPLNIPPGDYMIPRAATTAEMRTPEFAAKLKRGPVLVVTVMDDSGFNMGRSLVLWFVYLVVVSFCSAYVTSRALGTNAAYLEVFRFAGMTAFMGYAVALWQMTIWYRRSWVMSVKVTIDGLIFAALTAGVFGWLWPR